MSAGWQAAAKKLGLPGAAILLGIGALTSLWLLLGQPAIEGAEARALACEAREWACAERLDACYEKTVRFGEAAGAGAREGTR